VLRCTRMPGESARSKLVGARRFEIVSVLGEGGMGVVYAALDREIRRTVALKTLRSLDAAAVLRFKNEFRSLQDIEHPNLVSLGELFEEDGQLFFTMELVQGTPFVDYIRPASPITLDGEPSTSDSDAAASDTTLTRSYTVRRPPRSTPPAKDPPAACFDEARLRDAFGQLARGIHALHRARKVHRDIKPSNVLVTAAGRVVVLDFGLIMSVSPRAHDTAIVGTAHYMAPEQAAGRAVGPEADWYSMGVMLYLSMTGVFPFCVSSDQVLERKQASSPPPPGAWVHGLPPDLAELCVGLLRKNPSARPKGREVLRALGVGSDVEVGSLSARSPGFVGRRRELTTLHDAFVEARHGAPLAVLIEGESGMGKSALMRRFIEEVKGDALVLAGRCYEREAVHYKAVDEVIDALSRHLAGRWASEVEEILPPRAALLGDVFPVLRMIPALGKAKPEDALAIDALELRALVFATLRELLARLARVVPVVVAIDDLQWADADSLALLAEVMRPHADAEGAPAILLVATVRTGPQASPPPQAGSQASPLPQAGSQASPPPQAGSQASPRLRPAPCIVLPRTTIRAIELDRLPAGEAQELVAALLSEAAAMGLDAALADGEERAPVSRVEINAEALVEEAGGHPLFIDALLLHRLVEANDGGPVRLDEALWARIQRLEPRAQALVELVAVAGGPLSLEIAARTLDAGADELARLTAALRDAKLARKSGAGREERIEPYHDRIREIVASHLDPRAKRAFHERLACALEAQGSAELEALAVHFYEAGDVDRAAEYAARAGEEAAVALAFDRAARLFKTAIEWRHRDRRVWPEG